MPSSHDLDCCVDDLGDMIQNLVRTLQIFERGKLTRQGFTMSQCYTLINIANNQSLSMQQLSDKMNLDNSTMTRIVSTLIRDGYVLRQRPQEDRRIIQVSLTAKGQDAVVELNTEIRNYYQHIIDAIPDGQVDSVMQSVNTLLLAFEKARPFCC